jgi:hypothetical protein
MRVGFNFSAHVFPISNDALSRGCDKLTKPPPYFQKIRESAESRWRQLEDDAELAGPWRQLFTQVQSPRHVVSELLQNADDAGATEASVSIEEGTFVFEHNGKDFTEQQFRSLCQFCQSAKRTLQTIGFRGIGFKSTFSIGPIVKVLTPTLRVEFEATRFTQPRWINDPEPHGARTRISVQCSSRFSRADLEKNLTEWIDCPYSLLFFQNLRSLTVSGARTRWTMAGDGPVARSRWMQRDGSSEKYLVFSSEAIPFPSDALAEIRQERGSIETSDVDFPPCRVDIVLGAPGRLYVVLPTELRPKLPFACNAPFLQDPARMRIKDPQVSPTNNWLLKRIGELAGDSMATWVNSNKLSLKDRATAYEILPAVDLDDASLEGDCAARVMNSAKQVILGKNVLLTGDGRTLPAGGAVGIPREIRGVWAEETASRLFDDQQRPLLSKYITEPSIVILRDWGLTSLVTRADVVRCLTDRLVPRPDTLQKLLALHVYFHDDVVHSYRSSHQVLKLFPAAGKSELYGSNELVHVVDENGVYTHEEWTFLSRFLVLLDREWVNFLDLTPTAGVKIVKDGRARQHSQGLAVLKKSNFESSSNSDDVISSVAQVMFDSGSADLKDCIALAQISARLKVRVDDSFRFVDRARTLRPLDDGLLGDHDGRLERITPPEGVKSQFLHRDYTSNFHWCTRDEWRDWIGSGGAGLPLFFLPTRSPDRSFRLADLTKEYEKRGASHRPSSEYKTNLFRITDFDFPKQLWDHWSSRVASGELAWAAIGELLLKRPLPELTAAAYCHVFQATTTKYWRPICKFGVPASWLVRLRELPILPDREGCARIPRELLRRTPDTDQLVGVEPFVNARLDTPATRLMLDILGVDSTPPSPMKVVESLRSLAGADKLEQVTTLEAKGWYSRLDQMSAELDAETVEELRRLFNAEGLILTSEGDWSPLDSVVINANEDDVPGAVVLHPELVHLALWHRLGMADQPTIRLAMKWIAGLQSGKKLNATDAQRVRKLQCRTPDAVCLECRHWLTIGGYWVPIDSLRYSARNADYRGFDLYPAFKSQTADCEGISEDVRLQSSLASLVPLGRELKKRIEGGLIHCIRLETPEWCTAFAALLARVQTRADEDVQFIRRDAQRLSETRWFKCADIRLSPCIGDMVVGTARQSDVAWIDTDLYFADLPQGKLALKVPEELGKHLVHDGIREALIYSFGRSPQDIEDYFVQNFTLADPTEICVPGELQLDRFVESLDSFNDDSVSIADTAEFADITDITDVAVKRGPSGLVGQRDGQPRIPGDTAENPPTQPRAPGDERVIPLTPRTSSGQFRSYVTTEIDSGSSDDVDPATEERAEVGSAAIQHVLEWEMRQHRAPTDENIANPMNEGYDISSRGSDGEVERFIEVKGTHSWGGGNKVTVTPSQIKFALTEGPKAWLYVVVNPLSDSPQIYRIQDYARQIWRYGFDDGWTAVAEGNDSEVQLPNPECGMLVRLQDGRIGTVSKVFGAGLNTGVDITMEHGAALVRRVWQPGQVELCPPKEPR